MMRCCICGRPTHPYLMIGAEAVGPSCAKRLGLSRKALPKGSKVRFVKPAAPREKAPETLDLFAYLEEKEQA